MRLLLIVYLVVRSTWSVGLWQQLLELWMHKRQLSTIAHQQDRNI